MSAPPMNCPPEGFDAAADLPAGFMEFLKPLHERFSPWREELVRQRAKRLAAAQEGDLPQHLPESEANRGDWKIDLPAWCLDQRNQMTGPANDGALVVKMLNSGAPGVMIDI